jgi:hypothetical protein
VLFHIVTDLSTDLRQYNPPSVDEFAVIRPGDHGAAHDLHDIVMHDRGGQLSFIHDHHHAYTPLHYILFQYGTPGLTYHLSLKHTNQNTSNCQPDQTHKQTDISQVQYYSVIYMFDWDSFPLSNLVGDYFNSMSATSGFQHIKITFNGSKLINHIYLNDPVFCGPVSGNPLCCGPISGDSLFYNLSSAMPTSATLLSVSLSLATPQ